MIEYPFDEGLGWAYDKVFVDSPSRCDGDTKCTGDMAMIESAGGGWGVCAAGRQCWAGGGGWRVTGVRRSTGDSFGSCAVCTESWIWQGSANVLQKTCGYAIESLGSQRAVSITVLSGLGSSSQPVDKHPLPLTSEPMHHCLISPYQSRTNT